MQKCSICFHPNKNKIDEALLLSTAPLRTIADQFQVSKTALLRHKANHIPKDLVKAKEADEICRAEGLLNKLINLKNDAQRITKLAETNDDLKTALSGIREQTKIIEILAKMQGQIKQPQIDLTVNNFTLTKIHTRMTRKLAESFEANR